MKHCAILCLLTLVLRGQAEAPTDNPLADYKSHAFEVRWESVVDISGIKGDSDDARFAGAKKMLRGKKGGVIYFPAGEYHFKDHLVLENGMVIRGETMRRITDARRDGFDPPTKFYFPAYKPTFQGNGTPNETAFKGIHLAEPATASHCGIIHISIHRGHIHFPDDGTEKHEAGSHRFVVGCALKNAAVADPAVPDLKMGQHPWQRFTQRHHAAVEVKGSHLLIANNRLPASGEENFTMKNYIAKGRKGKETLPEVVFDYDNRPGLYVNDYGIGAAGGSDKDDGVPKTYPWGFRKGIMIQNNYVYCTGRCAIAFCGDGVICSGNVIRFKKGVYRPTATGRNITTGSSTNDNRAVQMRGWRWTVSDNDYEVHRNVCADRNYLINDGEGLMHEDHVNSTILDSKLINNKGNSYLSLYKTGGINGLLVSGNEITTGGGIPAIYVNANRNSGKYECRNVTIEKNVTQGSGILIAGSPSSGNVVKDNRHQGPNGRIINEAGAKLIGNVGYAAKPE